MIGPGRVSSLAKRHDPGLRSRNPMVSCWTAMDLVMLPGRMAEVAVAVAFNDVSLLP
jgi:hypothetical protein